MSTIEQIDSKLVEIAAIGKTKHYFGKKYISEEIKKLSENEKLALYESYIVIEQAEIASSMKDTFVTGIAELSCCVFGIKNKKGLTEDLQNDPFTEKLVGKVASSLYNSFGYLLAPVSVGSIIAKHKLKEKYDGEEEIVVEQQSENTPYDTVNVEVIAETVNDTLGQL